MALDMNFNSQDLLNTLVLFLIYTFVLTQDADYKTYC